MTHTLGKFVAEREGSDVYVTADHVDGPGNGVFTIAHLKDGFGYYGTPEETDANAALFSAGPDMLNALRLAGATIERLQRHAPGTANGTLHVIETAVAKAEGRKPVVQE